MTSRTRCISIFLIFAALLLTGCEDADEARVREINFNAAYQEAIKDGEELGGADGREIGTAAAEKDAIDGSAWQLYYNLALASLLSGTFLGLIIQYGVLLRCRQTQVLPQFSTVAFVPAMKASLAYSIFERSRDVKINFDEQLREIALRKDLRFARMEELKGAVAKKIETMSSIEELTETRIVQLFEDELQRIVEESDNRVRNHSNDNDDNILDL